MSVIVTIVCLNVIVVCAVPLFMYKPALKTICLTFVIQIVCMFTDKDALVNDLTDALAAADTKFRDLQQEHKILQSLLFPTGRCK